MERINKELEELETRKTELYRQRQMLFIKLKSAVILLKQYIEFAEREEGLVQETSFKIEIKQILEVIDKILGFAKLPSDKQEEMVPIPKVDEEIKRVREAIENKIAERTSILGNR